MYLPNVNFKIYKLLKNKSDEKLPLSNLLHSTNVENHSLQKYHFQLLFEVETILLCYNSSILREMVSIFIKQTNVEDSTAAEKRFLNGQMSKASRTDCRRQNVGVLMAAGATVV